MARVAAALLTLSILAAACALDDHPVLYVENDTTVSLDVGRTGEIRATGLPAVGVGHQVGGRAAGLLTVG